MVSNPFTAAFEEAARYDRLLVKAKAVGATDKDIEKWWEVAKASRRKNIDVLEEQFSEFVGGK